MEQEMTVGRISLRPQSPVGLPETGIEDRLGRIEEELKMANQHMNVICEMLILTVMYRYDEKTFKAICQVLPERTKSQFSSLLQQSVLSVKR